LDDDHTHASFFSPDLDRPTDRQTPTTLATQREPSSFYHLPFAFYLLFILLTS